MSRNCSDLVLIDFLKLLTMLSLSEPITYGGPPSISQLRKYCTRVKRGGYGGLCTMSYRDIYVMKTARENT